LAKSKLQQEQHKENAAAIEFYNKQFYALSTLEFAFVVASYQ